MDTGRMAFRSQTRRARGDLGLPFFISCGRNKMKTATSKGKEPHKKKTEIWIKNNWAPSRFPSKMTDTFIAAKKLRGVRKPKALRGMR